MSSLGGPPGSQISSFITPADTLAKLYLIKFSSVTTFDCDFYFLPGSSMIFLFTTKQYIIFFLTAICDYKRRKTEPVIKNLLSSLFLTFIPIPAKFVNWFQRVYENLTFGSDCLHEFYIAYSVDNHVLLLSQRHNINIIHYNLFAAYWRVKKEKLVRRKRCL